MALFTGQSKDEDVTGLIARKNYAKAIEVLKTQLKTKRGDPRVRMQLGDVLILAGKGKEAIPILLPIADEYAREGFAAKAVAVLKKIQKIDPGRRDVETKLASLIEEKQKQATVAVPAPAAFELGIEEIGGAEIGFSAPAGEPISLPSAEPEPEPEPPPPPPRPAAPPQPPPRAAAPKPQPQPPPRAAAPKPAAAPPPKAAAPRPAPRPPAPEPEPVPVVEAEPELALEAEPELSLQAEPELSLEPEPVPEPEPEPVPVSPAAEAEPGFGLDAESFDLDAQPGAEPEPEPTPVVDRDLVIEEGGIEVEPEIEAEPVPAEPMSESLFAEELMSLVDDVFQGLTSGGETEAAAEALPAGGAQIVVSPLFKDFGVDEMVAVIQGLKLLTFERGDVILREGQRGDSLYMLASGKVKAFVKKAGKQVPVAELDEGAFFGEISILTGKPRAASVVATTRCELLELDRPTLDSIVQTHPHVMDVLKEFADQRMAASR